MRGILTSLFLILAICALSRGQTKSRISGLVVDEEKSQPVIQAGIQLLSPSDSSMVEGAVTDNDGRFSIPATPGDYILKVSFIGYKPLFRNIRHTLSQDDRDLGAFVLSPDALFLKNAIVTAKASPVTIVEDTVVYNAAAYRVAEDATLKELLKKIPGLEISGGQITLQGKEVKQLLVGGRKFFGGDVRTGLKNISADMVENIRAYERESDMARLTGIEDGEEEAVIDLTIKKEMMNSWRNRVAAGGGNYDRYLLRANATNISKKKQITVIANTTNASPAGLSKATSRNVLGSGSSGDSATGDAGITFSNQKGKLSAEGSVQFTRTSRDAESKSRSETIHSTSMNYSGGMASVDGIKDTFKSSVNLEWALGNGFTMILNPVFSFDHGNTYSNSVSSTYKKDPYTEVEGADPFDWMVLEPVSDPFKSIRVNTTNNISQDITRRMNASVSLQMSKRLSKPGRTVSFRTTAGLISDHEWEGHDYITRYYKIKNHPDSARLRKQYLETTTPTKSFSTQVSYSEPLSKKLSIQMSYTFSVKKNENVKDFYSLQNAGFTGWSIPSMCNVDGLVGSLPAGFESAYDGKLSAEGIYTAFTNRVNLNLRYLTKKIILTGGATFVPQNTVLTYLGTAGTSETVRTSVLNVSPQITARIKKSKNKQFVLTYRGNGSQPSMYNLMPVANGTLPTNVHYGNPYLKPSFVQVMRINYNFSNLKKQNSFVASAQYTTTSNAVCNSTEYDPESGVRTSTPKNIDGNWRAAASTLYNKTLRDSRFSVSSHTSGEYLNSVAYLYNTKLKKDETNLTNRIMFKEMADLTFRNDWLELMLGGGGDWTDEKSLLRPDMNQTPYSFHLEASTDLTLPWGMHISADFTGLAQRGYAYDELNRNYYLLNARATQSVMKGKGTIRLDLYDLLGQTTNLVRSFSAEKRSIATYNGVNSYALLRFVYKFKPRKEPISGPSKKDDREIQRPQLQGLAPQYGM